MEGIPPGVFVSSTYYDLKHVRDDLRKFIGDELGYRPFLFEHSSFPINPDTDTIENCRQRVQKNADIFVLIIGAKLGYVDPDADKSVTNIEYVAARAKGIPIYAFVDSSVLRYLEVWKKNKDSDVRHLVDNPKLFDFVELVRSADRVWVREFITAGSIIEHLRLQLSYLAQDAFTARLRMKTRGPEAWVMEQLSGEALSLAIDRPDSWEKRLFAQILTDEVAKHIDARREYDTGLSLGPIIFLDLAAFEEWQRNRLEELRMLIDWLQHTIATNLHHAFRPDGTAGDVADIYLSCREIARGYRHAIDWTLGIRRTRCEARLEKVVKEFSKLADDVIRDTGDFGPASVKRIAEALQNRVEGTPSTLTLNLNLRFSNFEAFMAALKELTDGLN